MVKYDFYIHKYRDNPTRVIDQIKQFHPDAKAIIISDEEERLKDKSTRWITRWFDVARENDSELIVKVDPDSFIKGGFTSPLPNADFFGKVIKYRNYGEDEKRCIHGGHGQFLSRRFIDLIYDQITDDKFWNKAFMYGNRMLSVDKVLSYLAVENEIEMINYDANIDHGKNL